MRIHAEFAGSKTSSWVTTRSHERFLVRDVRSLVKDRRVTKHSRRLGQGKEDGYRLPSLRNLTGYNRVERQAKRELRISQVQARTKPSRVKQRAKQHVGYDSPTMRLVRNIAQSRFPSFLGLFGKK